VRSSEVSSALDRSLVIRLVVPSKHDSRVPLALLADKLHAAQRALLSVGSALRGGGRRGSWKSEVLQACELFFVKSSPGSLQIETEVALPIAFDLEGYDLGLQALTRLSATLEATNRRDTGTLRDLYPDYGARSRVAKSILPMLPEEGGDYEVEIAAAGEPVRLEPELRSFLNLLDRDTEREGPEEAVRTLTGLLFRIEVATGERQLGLIVQNRQVSCYYAPEYEQVVREFVPGSLVEVEGRATLDDRGGVIRIEEILDARAIQLVPLFWQRVIYGNRLFRLKRPIQVAVDFQDGLWLHEFEPLGIVAYAPTRAESLDAFRADFTACWDEIAQEEDANLTRDAVALKGRLLDIVDHEEALS